MTSPPSRAPRARQAKGIDTVPARNVAIVSAALGGGVSLPREAQVREFVEFYYSRYEAIGNETDPSNERAKWL